MFDTVFAMTIWKMALWFFWPTVCLWLFGVVRRVTSFLN